MMSLLFFDIETTSADPLTARIVSMAFLDQDDTQRCFMVNPGVPLPPEATEIHGITDKMVEDQPFFDEYAVLVQGLVDGRTLASYNGKSFDARVLDRQLREAGQRGISDSHPHVDAFVLWQSLEKRTLANAIWRYAPRHQLKAHDALNDALGTRAVIRGMMHEHQLDAESLARLTSEADVNRWVTSDRRWKFGKNRGRRIRDDHKYANWVLSADFPAALKLIIQEELA